MSVRCYLLEETSRAKLGLRRYRGSEKPFTPPCSQKQGYHDRLVYIGEIASAKSEPDEYGHQHWTHPDQPKVPHDDSRWPVQCVCGYVFRWSDEWQVWTEAIYRRADTGADTTLRASGPGAMWDAWWMGKFWQGPDSKCLVVKLPNGNDWMIDGRASNCDSPCEMCGVAYKDHDYKKCDGYKDARPHKCWVRHGEPPNLTVDKAGAPTCNAGAGSILSGDYHGFLTNGCLT